MLTEYPSMSGVPISEMDEIEKSIYDVLSEGKQSSNELKKQVEKRMHRELPDDTYYRRIKTMTKNAIIDKEEIMNGGVRYYYYSLKSASIQEEKIAKTFATIRTKLSERFKSLKNEYDHLSPAGRAKRLSYLVLMWSAFYWTLLFWTSLPTGNFKVKKQRELVGDIGKEISVFIGEKMFSSNTDNVPDEVVLSITEYVLRIEGLLKAEEGGPKNKRKKQKA